LARCGAHSLQSKQRDKVKWRDSWVDERNSDERIIQDQEMEMMKTRFKMHSSRVLNMFPTAYSRRLSTKMERVEELKGVKAVALPG